MSGIAIAIAMGWLALSGQVAADTEGPSAQEIAERKAEDLQWKKRLLAVTNVDRWNVGAKIGMDLVSIPGDRPYELLAANWKKIAVNARKQILKGFTPGMMGNKEMHSRFFDVMHLGMSDKDAEVRSFAANYLKMQGLPDYESDLAAYRRWRNKTEKLTAQEVMKLVGSSPDENLSSGALTDAGWELWKARKYGEAKEKFSLAVEKDPKEVNAWNGLGWSLFNGGQGDQALPAFRQCVKLSPGHPAALNGLGQVYFSLGEYKPAEKYLKKAAPRAPAAWWGLTKVYLLTGKYKLAAPWAEKVAAGSPNDPTAKQMLAAAQAGELSDELRQMIEPYVVAQRKSAKE